MCKLKRFTSAIILSATVFLTASFGREQTQPPEPPEEPSTGTPVTYDDSAEEIELRKQAYRSEVARARAEEGRKEALEAERQARIASKPKEAPVAVSRGQDYVGQAQTFQATAYTAKCAGCSGITKTGVDIRQTIYHEGKRVIAVDPRWIPLGSIVRVTLADGTEFEAIAEDIGGAIKGNIIDVVHETKADANRFGRQTVEVRLIRKGR